VGLTTSALGGLVGGAVGIASGYERGVATAVIQPILDIMQGFPLLVLALVLTAALGPSLLTVIVAIAVPFVPRVARVVRATTLAIRESTYVEAAQALGASGVRVAVRHIVPNTLAPLIVLTTAQLGSAILVEAALSFLGLGVPEPYPSWGRMLSVSAAEFAQRAPWVVIFPGVAISVVVFASNLLGDSLRDFLDPRLRI
jgi:peptide/nickel transport system permease protein